MSAPAPEEWTPEGLVEHFWHVHRKMHDRRFCFILGAGASVQSGIPAAGALVWRWIGELHQRLDRERQPLARWATPEAIGIPGFALEQAASFYSQVFERRFRQSPDEGYADLEDIMQGKDPSFGYSVLAHILADTRHKLVITTNFDNLVTDALSIFTATSPLVCGHESLAAFIRVAPRRPVVVKIHRDLLMAPMNRAEEIAALRDPWVDPLTRIFAAHTPIVLGYGGNDGSLMGFLRDLPAGAIVGGLFWCYYGPGGRPGREICDLVAKHGGALVAIDGFDELMLRLTARLGIPLLDQVIETKARTRVESYRRRVEELRARTAPPEPPQPVASDTSDEPGPPGHAPPASRAEPPEPVPTDSLRGAEPARRSASEQPAERPRATLSATAQPAPPTIIPRTSPVRGASPAASAPAPRPSPTRSASPPPSEALESITSPPPAEDEDLPFDIDLPADITPAAPSQPLERVLQQVAAETAETSPFAALTQARLERDPMRRMQALRAAAERFPQDAELCHALAEELSAVADPASTQEATTLLKARRAGDPTDLRALVHLALLWAWQRDTQTTQSCLRQAWHDLSTSSNRAELANLAFVAGLLARLSDRDDTRFLALLKSAVRLHPPRRGLPEGIVRRLLERLDRPSRRTYVRLLSMFVDGAAPHRVELVEPRFAAVPAADLSTLSADEFTWPQSQPG
jgi:hypothetical protein